MARKTIIYEVVVEVDEARVNAAAKHMIPRLVRQFGTDLKIKLALVAGTDACTINGSVIDGHLVAKNFPLTPEEDPS